MAYYTYLLRLGLCPPAQFPEVTRHDRGLYDVESQGEGTR